MQSEKKDLRMDGKYIWRETSGGIADERGNEGKDERCRERMKRREDRIGRWRVER